MSHEITKTAGKNEMAYAGEKPWHGLGQELPEGASIEEWKIAAGMQWKIQRSKVRYVTERGAASELEMPDQHVLFRSDTKAALSIVSERYKVVQPGEALEFFRELTISEGYKLETAGTLFGGKKFWALAKVAEGLEVGRGDKINPYLLFASSCDGSLGTTIDKTAVRVVCNNTISMALSAKSAQRVVVSHRTKITDERLREIKSNMGLVRGEFVRFAEAAKLLSRVNVTDRDARSFVLDLLSPKLDGMTAKEATEATDKTRDSRGFQAIVRLFNGEAMGSSLQGVKGTAWGLLNSVTEYVDHGTQARSDSSRLDSAWFGAGDTLKTRTLEKLLTLA